MRRFAVIVSFPLFILAMRFIPFDRLPPVCTFYRVTGYPCPTCGMTRAIVALTHLDLARSISLHPPAVLFLGAFAGLWALAVHEVITQRRTTVLDWVRRHLLALTLVSLGLLLLYGVLRIVGM